MGQFSPGGDHPGAPGASVTPLREFWRSGRGNQGGGGPTGGPLLDVLDLLQCVHIHDRDHDRERRIDWLIIVETGVVRT
jgi:hypothetical protein